MKQSELISHLEEETNKLIEIVKSFQKKDLSELRYQQSQTSWSALQCIEHLNRYSEFYLREFELRIKKAKLTKHNNLFKRGFWGKLFTKGMLPDENMKKMKAFKKMNPSNKSLDRSILEKFLNDQEKIIVLLESARKIDLNQNNCNITIPLIRMRIGDCLMFYTYHNIRHVDQAKNTIN